MKKVFFLFVCLLFFFFSSFAQTNLVPNPSFEVLKSGSCDSTNLTVDLAFPWKVACQSPDIYNGCFSATCCSVPCTGLYVCRPAHSGIGYFGIIQYDQNNFREIFQVELNSPMQKNKKYFLDFFAIPAVYKGADILQAADAVGIAVSDTLYKYRYEFMPPWSVPNYEPVVENRNIVIKDTSAWTHICGLYKAKGTEKFILLGNFRKDAEVLKSPTEFIFSYLYIDDVGVYEFDVVPDTVLLCAGERVELGKKFLDATYRWSNGSTDSSIVVSQAGRYIVTVTIDKCSVSDTVVVVDTQQDDWLRFLPNDTLLCKGEKLNIKLPTINDYRWSDGDTSNQKIISKGGYYGLEVRNRCKTWRHDFDVTSKVCECRIYVPSAFSPNSDGINDELEYYIQCDFPHRIHRFQVFDRWGVLLYATSAADGQIARWDGTFRGQPLGAGVYVWSLEYEYTRSNGEVINDVLSGDVSILK